MHVRSRQRNGNPECRMPAITHEHYVSFQTLSKLKIFYKKITFSEKVKLHDDSQKFGYKNNIFPNK